MRNLAVASLDWVLDNPVINKELRGRMRGPRAYWMMLGYLLILSIAMLIAYYTWRQHDAYGGTPSFTVGRNFFRILFYVQATLVSLLTPALTSGAISVEREQRTYEMMRCTNLRPAAVVAGKLFSAVSFITLLLICSIPLVAVCFLVGGVSPDEVISTYAMLIVDGVLFGAIGLAWSTCAANTAAATSLSYVSVFIYFLVTAPFAMAAQSTVPGNVPPMTALNPIGAVTSAATIEHYFGFKLAAWVTGMIVNGLLTLLMCAIAANRMADYPWSHAAGVRISAFLWAGAVLFFMDGAWVANAFQSMTGPTHKNKIISSGLVALILFLPSLVTGEPLSEIEHGLPMMPMVLTPARAIREATTRASLTIGLLFAAMVTLATCQTLSMAFASLKIGAGSTINVSAYQSATVAIYGGMAIAIIGIGALLSNALRNRWGAMMLLFVIISLALLVPTVTFGLSMPYGHDPGRNWLYFSPIWTMTTIDSSNQGMDAGLIFSGIMPGWGVTSMIFTLIGLFTLAGAVSLRQRLIRTSAN